MSFRLHDSDTLAVDFEQVIVSVICFLVIFFLFCLLTRYWFVSCQQHAFVTGFVSFAITVCWLTLNRSLFRFYCIWYYLLNRNWFVQCQQTCTLGLSCRIILVQWLLIEQVTVSKRLFSTLVLCIYFYIILNKGYHILYVLGLNSSCVCVSKVSILQCVLVYDAIF